MKNQKSSKSDMCYRWTNFLLIQHVESFQHPSNPHHQISFFNTLIVVIQQLNLLFNTPIVDGTAMCTNYII